MSSLDLIGYLIWLNTRQLSPASKLGRFCLAIQVRLASNPLFGSIATAGGIEGWPVSERKHVSDGGACLTEGRARWQATAATGQLSLAGYLK